MAERRQSLVFFHNPNYDALIECICPMPHDCWDADIAESPAIFGAASSCARSQALDQRNRNWDCGRDEDWRRLA